MNGSEEQDAKIKELEKEVRSIKELISQYNERDAFFVEWELPPLASEVAGVLQEALEAKHLLDRANPYLGKGADVGLPELLRDINEFRRRNEE